jgi:hypothetical protein
MKGMMSLGRVRETYLRQLGRTRSSVRMGSGMKMGASQGRDGRQRRSIGLWEKNGVMGYELKGIGQVIGPVDSSKIQQTTTKK